VVVQNNGNIIKVITFALITDLDMGKVMGGVFFILEGAFFLR